jgi:hypothetical protein
MECNDDSKQAETEPVTGESLPLPCLVKRRHSDSILADRKQCQDGRYSQTRESHVVGDKVRRERRWTSAGDTPARELVRSTR